MTNEDTTQAAANTEGATKNYDMVGFGRKARTRVKGEEYITISFGKEEAATDPYAGRYAIYTNEDGMVLKTRPAKGSTDKSKLVGTAEEAQDKKGGTFTIAKFNDESLTPLFLFPNRKRSGENPPDFYVTRQA
jgi:hypothetical protein